MLKSIFIYFLLNNKEDGAHEVNSGELATL